jgi:hypothetical protein
LPGLPPVVEHNPEHIAMVCTTSETRTPEVFYASCSGCYWVSEFTEVYREAALMAVEHSDEDAIARSVADMQLTYPHLTREQILGLSH